MAIEDKKYEILEHPAELRIRVYGKTLEELFSNAVLAMGEILNSDPNIRMHPLNCRTITASETSGLNDPNVKKEIIKIKSIDLNSLLVDFLSEILALSQINMAVYEVVGGKINIHCHPELDSGSHSPRNNGAYEMPKPSVTDALAGRQVRHDVKGGDYTLEAPLIGYPVTHFDEDIKAVTYEDLDIKKVDNSWQTMIVFDI